jgi:tyrosinase
LTDNQSIIIDPIILTPQQRLWEIMIEYVNTSVPADQRAIWTAEANKWRLPYWDWAVPQPYIGNFGVPEICTWENITIVEPASKNGEPLGQVEVANPLWKFSNPLGIPMGDPAMGANAVGDADDAPVLVIPLSWPSYWF